MATCKPERRVGKVTGIFMAMNCSWSSRRHIKYIHKFIEISEYFGYF